MSLGFKRLSIDQIRVALINSGVLLDEEEFPGRWKGGDRLFYLILGTAIRCT